MKYFFYTFIFYSYLLTSFITSQSDDYISQEVREIVWVAGSKFHSNSGSYSSYGYPSFPSGRHYPIFWAKDNLVVIFGGICDSPTISCNDMHKSTSDITSWVWIGGCSNTNSGTYPSEYGSFGFPSSRAAGSSFILQDKMFLFGGMTTLSKDLNDLWYVSLSDIYSNKLDMSLFVFIGGCNTQDSTGNYIEYNQVATPSARRAPLTWVNSDNTLAYLFGGYSQAGIPGFKNDLFSFNSTHFLWLAGSDESNHFGSFPSSYNKIGTPDSRACALNWYLNGYYYIFGGWVVNEQYRNDLWSFTTPSVEYTYLAGCSDVNNAGVYNGIGFTGIPAVRDSSALVSFCNDFYLFGGLHSSGYLNDFWKFDTNLNNFVLLNGTSEVNKKGLHVDYLQNAIISARDGHIMIAQDGYIFLLFGDGFDDSGSSGNMNDIFRISVPCKKNNQSNGFILSSFQITMISCFSVLIIVLLVFEIFKSSLLYRMDLYYDKSYFFLPLVDTLSFVCDFFFIAYVFPIDLFIFILSSSLILFSIIVNSVRITFWIKKLRDASNFTDISRYIAGNEILFHSMRFLSMLISPSFLYILKSNFGDAFKFPLGDSNISIATHCVLHDIYSVIFQTSILYFFAFSNYTFLSWNTFLWIILILKTSISFFSIIRVGIFLVVGGGQSKIRKKDFKYGLFPHKEFWSAKPRMSSQRDLISESTSNTYSSTDSESCSHIEIYSDSSQLNST